MIEALFLLTLLLAHRLTLFVSLFIYDEALFRLRMRRVEPDICQAILAASINYVYFMSVAMAIFTKIVGGFGTPVWAIVVGMFLVLIGCILVSVSIYSNRYCSSTVEVFHDQVVAYKGVYGIVRHPMYLGSLMVSTFIPLAIGVAIPFTIVVIPLYIERIKREEQILSKDLTGYKEYMELVRYRLLPYIW